jgi:predicted metal-dependent enzyme (double-stranded beta helix superfamily)
VFELRLMLEPAAARMAAGKVDAQRLRALDEVCRAGYQPGDARSTSRFLEANKAFHVEIARAAGNARLADAVEQLLDEMTRLLHLGLGLRNRSQEMQREHREGADARRQRHGRAHLPRADRGRSRHGAVRHPDVERGDEPRDRPPMSGIAQLARLASRIDSAVGLAPDAMAREVQAALAEATARPDWLPAERRRASHDRYARHLLYGDPAGRYSILAIVWDHGQTSPVHGHHCWCAVGVYQGVLSESQYREGAGGGIPMLLGSSRRPAGTLSFDAAATGIHRIANESGAPAVSLHVYGVAKERISTDVNRLYPTA